ncbi:MAG: DUF3822 family protein [Cytophagales bacterium]|nr:DUF3822 family protein [Cytophagales bacterium]
MENFVHYSLVKKVKDDSFEVDHLHDYSLSLQVSGNSFRFCVIDTVKHRCMLIEDYSFHPGSDADHVIAQLAHIFEDNTLLKAGFWKNIKLSIKNLKFSLVPQSLFSEEYIGNYLAINCTYTNDEELHYFKHGRNDTVNIFASEKKITDWIKAQYPRKTIEIMHHTSIFIEGVFQNHHHAAEKTVYINVEENIVTIVVKKGLQLEFCNNFHYRTTNDFLYYVLFVYDELGMNPDTTKTVLAGNIHKNSELYMRLYKYIRHVDFSLKPASLKFAYNFDEVHDHRYFELYSMYYC